jgi:hypothetical protein
MTWDPKLLAYARALEAQAARAGHQPGRHRDEDVEAILEAGHDWQGDE